MTKRKSSHNQNTVPVLDQNGKPLAPARPSRVRQWLESRRATKVWVKGIFAVQLNDLDADTADTGNFALNIDPGEATGIAITRESPDGQHRTIVSAYEHQHRNNDIHHKLDDRRQHRRNRRNRLRRRPQRSDNRANARTAGQLPPSIQSIPDDAEAFIQTLLRLYPIKQLRAEYLRFDTQLMQNPNIKDVAYQYGTLHSWQIKHYIFTRDQWQCQCCDKPGIKDRPLTLDHIIPESKGGPTVVGNLVAAITDQANR